MRIILTFVFIGLSFASFAQLNWQLQKDENGIKVYTAENTASSVKSVRVEVVLSQPVDKVASVIMNVDDFESWVYGCIESSTISRLSDTSIVYRHVTDVPWPYEDRDLVAQLTKIRIKPTGSVSIYSTFQPQYAELEGYVRIKQSNTTWTLTPVPNGKTKTVYQLTIDPGGNIPAWLTNLFIEDGPYQTFINLQKKLGE